MKATFVLGLPQTQEQKNQARAAIQGNSSLIRWRKSGAATQAQPTRVRKRRKTDDQQSALTSTELVSSENKTSSTYSVLDIRYVDTPDFWNQLSRVGFDKTLDTPLLPPFLPLGYPDFHTKDDVWVKLQKSRSPPAERSQSQRSFTDRIHSTWRSVTALPKSGQWFTHRFRHYEACGIVQHCFLGIHLRSSGS